MRICSLCKEGKPATLEYFRGDKRKKNGLSAWCIPCHQAHMREYYRKNAQKYRGHQRNFIARRQAMLNEIKLAKGCADCGYRKHSSALDFDHLPGTEKWASVSMAKARRLETLMAEIEKCEVVCANCHRIRSTNRLRGIA